ncbi:DNA polymerase III subunit psi [Candidatus Palibaumannia cicadellinicola]|uniref:DNA polymerase III subunit psi n=1 Tax=Baumannia cicadellinicola subsp. Homalodisca coagulata TaxID=374463 RepID=Q1LSL4_BAUCH|nr:DNA polymerase III subunit psi [Candidatus Baumannia cicadellinicola]ABF14136.1 DNA polymerase III, psi subunit [Baumannia cicadellinicola str. Hc (Homalodisca coagulata)]MBS0032513.1 DNA polymerase III subunit psi [Candidatus Baumannia cicadellinicola]MCJ7461965.1 DNA polymerase III subunit psi [Candidatus Baumannia cicadellinicola]MCJ7462951.1 DNA polymerase III subunit psi [Candidatus Baumannia cicadellinicola]
MVNNINNYVKQLGIIQWILRYPPVLHSKEELVVLPPAKIRWLLVADQLPLINHPLISDVIRSMALIPEQLFMITSKQVMMLPKYSFYHCWWLGVIAIRNFKGISLFTPSLSVLRNNAVAKRDLWRQIMNYQQYLS